MAREAVLAMLMSMTPQLVDPQTAPEAELWLHHEFWNARRAEVLPDDPPIPWEERLKWMREPAEHTAIRVFAIYDQQQVLGIASADWRTNDTENPDFAWCEVMVAPSHLRRGLGSRLTHALFEEILPLGRKKMFTQTMSNRAGGKPFAEMLGAKFGQEEHTNQLLFSEMNRAYVQHSLEKAPTSEYELLWFDGEYPDDEEVLQKLCDMFAIMNTAPRGDLEFNDWKVTPEKLRQEALEAKKHNQEWWLCVAKHRQTGHFAGFTETGWHHNRPNIAGQYGTGVDPSHRGHGLGAWLKAVMIERILRDRPSVDRIRTGNADSNVPMLKINHSLGFKPFLDRTEWQIDIHKSLEILRAKVLSPA